MEKGNEATFLSKVEGVLDGLVQDMVSTGSSEAKVSGTTELKIILQGLPPCCSSELQLQGDLQPC